MPFNEGFAGTVWQIQNRRCLRERQTPKRQVVVGAVLGGKELSSFEFPTAGILVIGNEANGIREDVQSLLTEKLTIPRFGEAESLNAAVATSIFLWELRRGG